MVKESIVRETVEIPDGVDASVNQSVVSSKGPLGRLERSFHHTPINLRREGDEIVVEALWPDKKTRASVGAVRSHIRNMMTGVTKGFTYKLKIVYAHFPMSVKVKGQELVIENFGGERRPRTVNIPRDVKITIDGDDVIVKGVDLEEVSQVAANIEQETKIREKDPRIFLDGIYVYEKGEET